MRHRAVGWIEAGAIIALLLVAGCSGCAVKQPPEADPVMTADLTPFVQSALFTLHDATTGTATGNEVGLCLAGYRIGNVYRVTQVVVPPVQTGNTRTSVTILSCEGVPGHIGRAHFHPWGGALNICERSDVDARTHARVGFAVDVVICPHGRGRWYTATASGAVRAN